MNPAPRRAARLACLRGPVLLAAVALGATACSGDPSGPGGRSSEPITELPRALSAAEQEILDASNAFAFRLAGQLLPEGPGDNLFFSPLSVSMALGMTLNGADGATYEQMRDVLGFPNLEQDEINQAYRDLIALLVTLDPSVALEIGNSIWQRLGFPVRADFLARVREHFGAEVAEVDFGDPATLDRINTWVDEATGGTIAEMFQELPADVVMVLLNAIYFKGDWTVPFDEDDTRPADFRRPDGSVVTAELMNRDDTLAYVATDRFQAVDLPYGGQAFSMTVVLPVEGVSPAEIMAELDQGVWAQWLAGFGVTRVALGLPKFELEWSEELNDALIELGMIDAFDGSVADFSRLTPGGGVWIDLVQQKAFVSVDEKGTEASAATAVVIVDSAPPQMRVDRPFLFVLRERLSGTILFVGIVNDPTA
jgi:serpin B